MKIKRRQGVYYSIEAVIATVMVLSVVYIVTKTPPMFYDISKVNYKVRIYNSLKTLDELGLLRYHALRNDTSSIESALQEMLPGDVNIFVTIYDKNGVNLTTSFSKPFYLTDVIALSYYICGDVDNYLPREIRVYAWGFR